MLTIMRSRRIRRCTAVQAASMTLALAFRIGAVRETFEECGILLARDARSKQLVDAARAGEIETRHRVALNKGERNFSEILKTEGIVPALDAAGAVRALDHAGRHAEALRHAVLPCRRAG